MIDFCRTKQAFVDVGIIKKKSLSLTLIFWLVYRYFPHSLFSGDGIAVTQSVLLPGKNKYYWQSFDADFISIRVPGAHTGPAMWRYPQIKQHVVVVL